MKIYDITKKIDAFAPRELAYDFDNVGLLCGSGENDVSAVLLTLDLDLNVIKEAKRLGANLIIGHHPILFEAAKQITDQTPDGRIITALLENKISYFAAHTNLDITKNGLNDLMAEKLGIKDTEILEYTAPLQGIGRIGNLAPITLKELAQKVKKAFNAPFVRICGDEKKEMTRIAVNTGGGAGLIGAALEKKADVLITGDYKYSQMRDCVAQGLNVIDVGHYNTEIICCEIFYNCLKSAFGDNLKIYISKANTNIMQFI